MARGPSRIEGEVLAAVGRQRQPTTKTKAQERVLGSKLIPRRRPTLPRGLPRSTIGAEGLNCRVRNGNGCGPFAKITGKTLYSFPIDYWSSEHYGPRWLGPGGRKVPRQSREPVEKGCQLAVSGGGSAGLLSPVTCLLSPARRSAQRFAA